MKIRSIISLLLLTSLTALNAQSELEVEIVKLRNNKGTIALELVDKDNKTVKGIKGKIVDKKSTILIEGLKDGKYAIRYFHDENSNDELDMNFLGIPKEGYGFSNDAYGKFGPKDFEEWIFIVSGGTKIKLTTKYIF